jgi:hypothetical protein
MFLRFKISRRTRRLLVFAVIQLLAVAIITVAFLWRDRLDLLSEDGRFSACLMHDLWHLYCPGCGGTRAIIAIFRGQILHSLLCNPLSAYILAGFVAADVRALVAIVRDEDRVLKFQAWYFWGMLALALLVFVVRNLLLVCFGIDYLGDLLPFWQALSTPCVA